MRYDKVVKNHIFLSCSRLKEEMRSAYSHNMYIKLIKASYIEADCGLN